MGSWVLGLLAQVVGFGGELMTVPCDTGRCRCCLFYLSVFRLETVVHWCTTLARLARDWVDRDGSSSLIIHALLTSCLIRAALFCLFSPSNTLVSISLASQLLRGTR